MNKFRLIGLLQNMVLKCCVVCHLLYYVCAVEGCCNYTLCIHVFLYVDEETSVTTALDETMLEVIDVSACVSAHDQLVKAAKFRRHGWYL